MTNKEIAERLDTAIKHAERVTGATLGELRLLKALIDPPRPEPGTVVWWRFRKDNEWQLGQVQEYNLLYSFGSDVDKEWADIEWKPARICSEEESHG